MKLCAIAVAVSSVALLATLTTTGWAANPPVRPSTAPAPRSCVLTRLPTPRGFARTTVPAGDATGRYIIGVGDTTAGRTGSVVWHDGTATATLTSDVFLTSVNSAGVAVGYSRNTATERPRIWRAGKLTPLPGVPTGEANIINDYGIITGTRQTSATRSLIVRWASATSRPVTLPAPKRYTTGQPIALDTDGTVIGRLSTPTLDADLYYVWPAHGPGFRLPAPPIPHITAQWILAVRGGTVTMAITQRGATHWLVRYDLHNRAFSETTVGQLPEHLNSHGWYVAHHNGDRAKPVLITPGHEITLPMPTDPALANAIAYPSLVSDDGHLIAGTIVDLTTPDIVTIPILWKCA